MKTIKRGRNWRGVLRVSLASVFFGGFLSSLLCGTTFSAPADFPKKEITIIVNMGPGGIRDILARGVGNTMSKYLGVPSVIMNTPGAGGARGLLSLYHAAPDGHTIGIGAQADIIDQILEKRDYDNKKFVYLGRAEHSPGLFFFKSDSSFRSVKDFKTYGKPVRLSAFSFTASTTVAAMVVANREGFPIALVGGYQGAAAAILALVRGEVELFGGGLSSTLPFIQSGQIRPILILSPNRSPDFPDVQTAREMGYPEVEGLASNYWLMAPPGVPKDRARILEDALMKTFKDTEYIAWAKGAGVDVAPLSGEEMTKMVFRLFELLERYKGDINKYVKK